MQVVQITMVVLIVISSLLLILTVLMHKGRGGGLSDMFGGGISSTAGSSGVAEKNLNRITVAVLCVWVVAIIAYGLLVRFYA
nr:preprotein translocase subunit SecG [Schaalia sp. JY-X169]